MKKNIFIAFFAISTLAFSQVTLEKTFLDNEYVIPYKDGNNIYYISLTRGSNIITIYNQNYSVYKTVNTQIPTNYTINFVDTQSWPFYTASRYLFNTDAKIEIFVSGYYYNSATSTSSYQSKILNEDGVVIKDFGNVSIEYFTPYTDPVSNKNKMLLYEYNYNGTTSLNKMEIYSLPTNSLTTKEIANGVGKLSAFPIPTSGILNIINPKNGNSIVEITDVTGKMIKSQNFGNEDRITLQVNDLPRGIYFYKIGSQNGKFIKE